jgi:hypothetical protein
VKSKAYKSYFSLDKVAAVHYLSSFWHGRKGAAPDIRVGRRRLQNVYIVEQLRNVTNKENQ